MSREPDLPPWVRDLVAFGNGGSRFHDFLRACRARLATLLRRRR
ncbi:hypothetical protein [Fodinicola acaciae]|nr:hypothetical protein [Fodinicola acaciae]